MYKRQVQVIGGETLGRFGIAFGQGIYMVIGTAVLFGVDWGDPFATTCVVAAFAAVSASAAMVLGSLMDNANAANGVGIGLGLVVAALGGSMLPLELFSDGLMTVSYTHLAALCSMSMKWARAVGQTAATRSRSVACTASAAWRIAQLPSSISRFRLA